MTEPLSLSPIQAFIWNHLLLEARGPGKLSANHLRVAEALQRLLAGGEDEVSHQELATAARCCSRTVGEATRRLRAFGLLDWQAQYRGVSGHRRRRENRYWLCVPLGLPIPPPDFRRPRRLGGTCRARQEERKMAVEGLIGRPPGFEARFAAKLAEERAQRRGKLLFARSG